ncbi:hypothetical protein ILUMI_15513 [Ignelater luminosus]|uniref:Uncharacterized protein n=1 Tax=Ignelater luminosus TaxID=2038154 RepID=A0A8K0CNH6_IGNLU|nr:hypothetical protein ILUMI_15513 [Ignelater luminosus]
MPQMVIWPNTEYRIFGHALCQSAKYSAAEYSVKDVYILRVTGHDLRQIVIVTHDLSHCATTSLKNYLKSKHATLAAVPSARESRKDGTIQSADSKVVPDTSKKQKQLTLKETTERKLLWDIHDPKSPFAGSHTDNNIAKKLNAIAERWNISQSKIHLLVHDSGTNMIKGVRVAQYDFVKCFIHSLQRAVEKSLKSQAEILELVAAARRIATILATLA